MPNPDTPADLGKGGAKGRALREIYGKCYDIGVDADGRWVARSNDGQEITTADAQTLREQLQAQFVTASHLKERGWTEAMIRDHLGEPDLLAGNPYRKAAAPMRYWHQDRVAAAENTAGFAARKAAAGKRAEASARSAANLRATLLDKVNAITVTVPRLADRDLARCAVNHRNEYMAYHASGDEREGFEPASPESADPDALARWKVNYLRHELTSYETELAEVAGKTGAHDARDLIRKKIYAAIADAYPDLAGECDRQLSERNPYA